MSSRIIVQLLCLEKMSKGKEMVFDPSLVDHMVDLQLFDPCSEDHLATLQPFGPYFEDQASSLQPQYATVHILCPIFFYMPCPSFPPSSNYVKDLWSILDHIQFIASCLNVVEIFSRECDETLQRLQDQQKFTKLMAISEFMASPSFRTILNGQFDLGFESFKILGK